MIPILDAPIFWTVQLVAVVVGFAMMPVMAALLAPSLPRGVRTALGRIIWTMAALINGPYVLRWPDKDGWPDLYPADPDQDAVLVDGEWREFDPDGNWSVLGMEPFGITFDKSDEAFGDVIAEPSRGDGGQPVIEYRGGQPVASHVPDDGFIVDILTVVERAQQAAGTRLNSKGNDEAMREHGGDTAEMSNKQIVIGTLGSMFLGGVFGVLLFGGVL